MKTVTVDHSKEWTVADFLRLEETNTPCELINGELIMSPSPKPIHQSILGNLNDLVRKAAKSVGGRVYFSPIDLYIDNLNVFQPDLLFLSKEKLTFITDRGIEGPPDLVVEVISAFNIFRDRTVKKKRYLEFGIKEYWIVDPVHKTIEIYTPEKGVDEPSGFAAEEGEIASSVLKTLRFNLTELFHE